MNTDDWKIDLQYVRSYLEKVKNREWDPQLAVYIFRDYPEVKAAGLYDLAWALCQETCSRNDAIGFFELLIAYLEKQEPLTPAESEGAKNDNDL